jgi:hypothetical protein
MRVSWYADTGIAVFSIWQGGTCTGTFRLPIPELPRMVDALSHGPTGGVGPFPDGALGEQQAFGGPQAGFPAAPASPTTVQAAGPPTAAMAPVGGYVDAPEQDYADPAQPPSHLDRRPGGYADAGPGGYGEVPAAGYGEAQRAGYGPEPRGAHQDLPQGYGDAPRGYADAPPGYGDAPHGYEDTSAGYQDGLYGYTSAPPEGYQDAASAGDYGAAGAGYPDPLPRPDQPARTPFSGGQGVPRTPTGPLPVGRWHEDEYAGGYPDAGPPGGGYGGAERGYQPEQGYQPEPGHQSYQPEPGNQASQSYQPEPGNQASQSYQPEPGYQAGQGYQPEPGYQPDQDYQADQVGDDIADDPLGGDYGGEAELGYLPGPPTETFRPVAVGSPSRQAGQPGVHQAGAHPSDAYQPAGYEPGPAGPGENSEYSPYTRPDDSPPESLAYHPGHAGIADREYRPSRGRS